MAVNLRAHPVKRRVLPLLYPETRARHNDSKRNDTIPPYYAEMSGEELLSHH